jgi:5-methylcytosine-specific restriction endonuclease McrA
MGAPRGGIRKTEYREMLRVKLLQRDGRHCHWCGSRMKWPVGKSWHDEMTFEHLVRRADGGHNGVVNLRLACRRCNNDRH